MIGTDYMLWARIQVEYLLLTDCRPIPSPRCQVLRNDVRVIASGTRTTLMKLTLDNVPRSVDIEKAIYW